MSNILCETNFSTIMVRDSEVVKIPKESYTREVMIWRLIGNHCHPYLIQTRVEYGILDVPKVAFVSKKYACSMDHFTGIRPSNGTINRFIIQIGSAIGFLSRLGIIHRDIKPANIFCTTADIETTDFILADLGSAVCCRDGDQPLYTEAITTKEYRAPEGDDYSIKSDAWAFGKIISKMVGSAADLSSSTLSLRSLLEFFTPFLHEDPIERKSCLEFWPFEPKRSIPTSLLNCDLVEQVLDRCNLDMFDDADKMIRLVNRNYVNDYSRMVAILKLAIDFYSPYDISLDEINDAYDTKIDENGLINELKLIRF